MHGIWERVGTVMDQSSHILSDPSLKSFLWLVVLQGSWDLAWVEATLAPPNVIVTDLYGDTGLE